MAAFSSQKFNSESLAAKGELAAQAQYEAQGYYILARNVFNSRGKRRGEIDFIALGQNAICFVEVKTRRSKLDRFGGARYSVGFAKQKKLLKLAKLFLLAHPAYRHLQPRIDVCLVEVSAGSMLDKSQFSVIIIAHAVNDEPM